MSHALEPGPEPDPFMEAEKGTASCLEFDARSLEFDAWSLEFGVWSLTLIDNGRVHSLALLRVLVIAERSRSNIACQSPSVKLQTPSSERQTPSVKRQTPSIKQCPSRLPY